MVSRIYVEKKPGFDVEAQQLKGELTEILGIKGIEALRIINRYDVEGIDEELFRSCVPTVFSEPQVDVTYDELPASDGAVFAVEFLPGQFDQRADSASECVQLISQGERPVVRSAKVYIISGALDEAAIDAIKHYVVNPVEARIASLDLPETLHMETPEPALSRCLTASASSTRPVLPPLSPSAVLPWTRRTSPSASSTSAMKIATPPSPRSA